MGVLSLILAIISLAGYVLFAAGRATSAIIFFSSLALAVCALALGLLGKARPWARVGAALGGIDVVIGSALLLWLTF